VIEKVIKVSSENTEVKHGGLEKQVMEEVIGVGLGLVCMSTVLELQEKQGVLRQQQWKVQIDMG